MKKNYKRIIKGILFICLTFFICFNVKDVNAEETKKCSTERFEVEIKNDTKTKVITIDLKGDSNQWNVYLVDPDEINMPERNFIYTGIAYTLTNDITKISYNGYGTENIGVILVKMNEECSDANEVVQKIESARTAKGRIETDTTKSFYIYSKGFQIPKNVSKDTIDNSSKSDLCADLQAGRFSSFSGLVSKTVFDASWERVTHDTAYKAYIPACYKSSLATKPSEEEIKNQIANALTSYYFVHFGKNGTLPAINGATKVTDPTKNIGLTCDYLNLDTSADYYVNKNSYYYEKTETKSETIGTKTYSCNKTCREVITVEYGPPVATIAGLCFEYKVKVKSEISCETETTGDLTPPSSDDYKTCEPVAYCESSSHTANDKSAGPNEEFDSCVNSCDNGKYTQKCINKCYNKVYANNNNQLLNYTDKIEATKLAACNGYITKEKILNEMSNADAGAAVSQEILSNSSNTECYGYYEWAGKKIVWVPGAAYWAKYARFYFLNSTIAAETIAHDKTNQPAKNVAPSTNVGRWKNGEVWYYTAVQNGSNIGFKTAYSWTFTNGTTGDYSGIANCDWTCSFIGCNVGDKLNPSDAAGDFENDSQKYRYFLNSCAAEATCSTTVAEFTIEVNNKTEDDNNVVTNNIIDFTSNIQHSNGSATITDSDKIILDSYWCNKEESPKTKYMTEWSFPGTWINNKTGEISYVTKTNTAWHYKKDKFCTSLNSADVNVGWWYYGMMKQMGHTGDDIKKNVETGATMSDTDLKNAVEDLNITATTRNFGHFKWNIDVSCFYALYNTSKKTDPDSDPDSENCTNPPCNDTIDENPVLRYRIRTVDNSDLFPSTDGTETTDKTKTGRTPGFNWTKDAANDKNEDYVINPVELRESIQTKGDSVYNEKAEYIFELDKEALKAIRTTNSNSYTKYEGTFEVINGVSVYKSSLFRGTGSTLDSKYITKLGTLGCNNQTANGESCNNY